MAMCRKNYNYRYHRGEMEKEFEQIAGICRKESMSEVKIELIYHTMKGELNGNRSFYRYTLFYDGIKFPDNRDTSVDNNPLMDKFLEKFSVEQVQDSECECYDWTEDMDTPEITTWLQGLKESDRQLLKLLVMDGLKQTEAAKVLGKHDSAISRKKKRLEESLAKVLPERLKKKYIG